MKAKSLICYKIGYNPDKKQKSKSVEFEEDGAKLIYVIPKELAMALAHTGPEKFHFFGQYCSGPFKAAWENELAQNFRTNAVRTNPVFDCALIGTWICFYGKTDLRKAALKMISKLKWKKICFVNMSTPP